MTLDDIPALQSRIDALDGQVVEALRQRFALSREIGGIKRAHSAPAFDPQRIGARRERFLRRCAGAGLPEEFGVALFGLIADQVAAERRVAFGEDVLG